MKSATRLLLVLIMGIVVAASLAACGGGTDGNTAVNTAPVANAGSDQAVTTGTAVTLDASESADADGDALTYSWSFTTNPGSAALSNSTEVNPTFTPALDGLYLLSLVVNDGAVNSAADSVAVAASPSGMALIPTGCFNMGDAFSEGPTYELPVHNVCITGFYMDAHETTNAEYKACVDTSACTPPSDISSSTRPDYYGNTLFDSFPVVYVNWNQATNYCTWAGKRLPTEAEWEYATRGGLSGKRYPWGDDITCSDANYGRFSDAYVCWSDGGLANDTHQVESYAPNGYGLYNMAGNVWEWTNDWFSGKYYNVSPTDDPQGPATDTYRVLRGGCWGYDTSRLRVAYRGYTSPATGNSHIGFRCARD